MSAWSSDCTKSLSDCTKSLHPRAVPTRPYGRTWRPQPSGPTLVCPQCTFVHLQSLAHTVLPAAPHSTDRTATRPHVPLRYHTTAALPLRVPNVPRTSWDSLNVRLVFVAAHMGSVRVVMRTSRSVGLALATAAHTGCVGRLAASRRAYPQYAALADKLSWDGRRKARRPRLLVFL